MRKKLPFSSLLALIFLFLGSLLLAFRFTFELSNNSALETLVGKTLELTGEVSADPSLSGSMTVLKLTSLTFSAFPDSPPLTSSLYVQVYVPKSLEVKRGDKITLKGKLSSGFGTYSASLFRPELLNLSHPSENFLLSARDSFSDSIKDSIPIEESSLGLAYLLGLRNGLSEELVEVLSIVGLTHIVVASGTHLSIIIEFMRKIFGKISRFAGLLFSILFILLFAELIGWTASITRAAIVSLVSLLAWYFGRKVSPLRVILFAMFLTLLVDPMNLTNLGWLLSFASFSGILILAPILTRFFYGKKKPHLVAEILLATLSATLMTAPILLYYFGSLSLISLLANLLILPTIPFAMGLTFLTGLFGFLPSAGLFNTLLSPFKFIVVKITTFVLDYHLLIIRLFGSQKLFLITFPAQNPLVFLLYLPLLLLFLVSFYQKFQKSSPRFTEKHHPRYFAS